ncbi:MFS general substrate transporter [Phellopilus nigrolimitatus]|nr:MFS general substrate transporter [Phellopilus nigrolimitatus]
MSTTKDTSSFVLRVQLALTCVSIAANALCAGGIFTFPLLSPALAEHLKLTQPQLTTIALAGMVGQYPFAALVGKAIDKYGPWSCSLASSALFSLGFGLFALETARTPDDITAPSRSSFERLALFFFLAGLGTVTSYFSSLFAASKNFPEYIGIASGSSMALFGLSPLFLSVIASTFFTSEESGLNVTQFVAFMAILAGVVHIIGAINLRTPSLTVGGAKSSEWQSSDERTPLIAPKGQTGTQATVIPVEHDQTVFDLLKDPAILVCLGSCEMVIGNIGTIVLSLPSSSPVPSYISTSSAASATAVQVRLLSLSNTLSRLLVGPLADFVSPVASYLPSGSIYFARKHRISRIAFLSAASALLALTYSWMELCVRSREGLWVLSIGTGVAYGAVFTALPGIVSGVWGLPNLGRNFGIITYAPFLGTPLFSYLYAFVTAAHTSESEGVCTGARCWRLTFGISIAAATTSLLVSVGLWKRWKGRV